MKGRKGAFVDSRGRRITDPEKLERIQELVIPPAWRDVWISPRPKAKLQATGVDRAGRRQYLYHPEFRARQEQEKFDRLVLFAERLPTLRKAMTKHIEGEPLEPEWTCALAIRLINLGWFRSRDRAVRAHDEDVRDHDAPQEPRLRPRKQDHRSLSGKAQGQSSDRDRRRDPRRGDEGAARAARWTRLFRYAGEDALVSLTGARLNEYIGEHLGEEFTAKDFRTWGGTLLAAIALAEHGQPETEAESKRVVAGVMRAVGERLEIPPR